MKKSLYDYALKHGINRRSFVKGAASAGAIAAMSGGLSSIATSAFADGHSELRKAILHIPGVGAGSPGDADWQKVGEMCLGGTKERVQTKQRTAFIYRRLAFAKQKTKTFEICTTRKSVWKVSKKTPLRFGPCSKKTIFKYLLFQLKSFKVVEFPSLDTLQGPF